MKLKLKKRKSPMYNVYKIDAKACYDGFALVAAESVEDANEIISELTIAGGVCEIAHRLN